MSVIAFPNARPRRRALYRSRGPTGPNMHTFLFRSYHLIVESDEADLVRDVSFDVNMAEKKLKAIRHQLKRTQELAAARVHLLTTAETKLTAAIVAALLSELTNGQ